MWRSSARLDHRAGKARTRIPGRLRFVVVGARVDDETPADDARGPGLHGDGIDFDVYACASLGIGLEIRHITGMALHAAVVAVWLAVGIEVAFRAHAIAGTAVTDVMNMKTILLIRL